MLIKIYEKKAENELVYNFVKIKSYIIPTIFFKRNLNYYLCKVQTTQDHVIIK